MAKKKSDIATSSSNTAKANRRKKSDSSSLLPEADHSGNAKPTKVVSNGEKLKDGPVTNCDHLHQWCKIFTSNNKILSNSYMSFVASK